MSALVLVSVFSLLIGAVLGLLGGGGGILAVPLLVYVVGIGTKPAIAMSLFFVGATSAIGAALAAREKRVIWKVGGLFAMASMASAFLGGHVARFVPERLLLGGLGAIMLATALAMARPRVECVDCDRPLLVGRVLGVGALVGFLSGLFGAGGGFLIVPALVFFGGLITREAIGTSLFVIALQSFAGFAAHSSHVEIPLEILVPMTGSAVVGMFAGSWLSKHVSARSLDSSFSALVFLTALFVLGRQIPLAALVLVALASLVVVYFLRRKIEKISSLRPFEPSPPTVPFSK